MLIQNIGLCGTCLKVWLFELELGADGYSGRNALVDGHRSHSEECHGEPQALIGEIRELPTWAQPKATELLKAFHWSQTAPGATWWLQEFEKANLPEVSRDRLESGTYTNADIAAKCRDQVELQEMLSKVPRKGSRASARSVLCMAIDLLNLPE